MTNDEKLINATTEERAAFINTNRFAGKGETFILTWLKSEATQQ